VAHTLPIPRLARPPVTRILVIDDDQLIARSINRMLATWIVTVETDPRAAIERIRAGECFDVVLCDLHMPELSGREVLAAIRAHFAGRADAPRLAAMSGDEDDLDREATRTLLKPFRAVALQTLLDELLPSPP